MGHGGPRAIPLTQPDVLPRRPSRHLLLGHHKHPVVRRHIRLDCRTRVVREQNDSNYRRRKEVGFGGSSDGSCTPGARFRAGERGVRLPRVLSEEWKWNCGAVRKGSRADDRTRGGGGTIARRDGSESSKHEPVLRIGRGWFVKFSCIQFEGMIVWSFLRD
jgi:hypothetical protein